MKKSDHSYSYRNLYQKTQASSRSALPPPGRMSVIEGKADRPSKDHSNVNSRKEFQTLSTNSNHSSKQFQSMKENDPRQTNRQIHPQNEPHQESLKQRSREFKLYTEMDQDTKYRDKAEKLQLELKRKLSDNGFLGFFKTANSSNFSHIDIYMELVNMEAMLNDRNRKFAELERKYSDAQKEIEELLQGREQNEQKFRQHIEQIQTFTHMIGEMEAKMEEREKKEKEGVIDERYNQLKCLFEDLQKQRVATIKRNKEVEQELVRQRESRNKEREEANARLESLKRNHESELSEAAQKYQQKEAERRQLAGSNTELHGRCELLSRESESLSASVRDLQEQLESDQTRHIEAQLEIESLREAIQDLEDDNNALKEKMSELQELKTKLHAESQKKNEYKNLLSEHMGKEKKLEDKLQQLKQELKKAQTSGIHFEDTVTGLKSEVAALKMTEKQLRENSTRQEYEMKILVEDKKRQEDLIARLESDLTKQSKLVETYQSERESNSFKLQCINEKKQSNERIKTVGRLKEMSARLRLHLSENFQLPPIKETDELEMAISQMGHIINGLMSEHLNPSRKQVEFLTISLKTMQLEKECFEESKQLELQSKQEALRVLIKFVPEETTKVVEEYLALLEKPDCRSETISKKVALLEAILKQTDRLRCRRTILHSQQSTKRSICESHIKLAEHLPAPAQLPTHAKRDKSTNRDAVRKYFE